MKVIICVDYSAYTEKVMLAVKQVLGTQLPQPEIRVVHIIDTIFLSPGTGGEDEQIRLLKEDGEKINQMAKDYFGPEVIYQEEYGVPKVKIDDVLSSTDYDLLVVGTRGRSSFTTAVFGSFAQHLLHSVKKPLLIIP